MTQGLVIDPAAHRIAVYKGGRTALTSDGTMVKFVPGASFTISLGVTFPDVPKDVMDIWTWAVKQSQDASIPPNFIYASGEYAACLITATPQEYSAKTVLASVPAGVNLALRRVRLNRTSAPASQWMGRTIDMLPASNKWIPWTGSALMEAVEGMSRALHITIDDDPASPNYRKLVLELEQSVGRSFWGYSAFGNSGAPGGASWVVGGGGGYVLPGATEGIPVSLRDSKSYGYTQNSPAGNSKLHSGDGGWLRRDGSNPCVRTDNTNYASTYSVEIVGRFGRR